MKLRGLKLNHTLLVLVIVMNLVTMSAACSQPQSITKEQYDALQNDLTATRAELERTKADLSIYKERFNGIKETWKTMGPKMLMVDTLLDNNIVWSKIRAGQTTLDENQARLSYQWVSYSNALTQLNDADLKNATEKYWFKQPDNIKWSQDQAAFYELFKKQLSNDIQKMSDLIQD